MKRAITIGLLAAVLLVAIWPLLRPYQVAGHSTYVDLVRVVAFHEAANNGDYSPRWLPDFYFHYGSPLFNFYAPLTYYVIELFHVIGDSAFWALKLAYLLFWLAAAAGMYFLARAVFDPDGAFTAAAVYGLAPYLLTDIYVRHGIAEFAAFAWIPWILLGLWRTQRAEGRYGPVLAALAYAGLILTHNITAMIASPFLLLFVAVRPESRRQAVRAAAALMYGLGLSAFFWLPAMWEVKYVQAAPSLTGGFFEYRHHFLAFWQLLRRHWDYGSSQAGFNDRMGFMYGEWLWLALVVTLLILAVPSARKKLTANRPAIFFLAAAAVCLFMTIGASAWLWGLFPLLSFVQFPWRFLLPASAFGAVLAAYPFGLVAEKTRPYLSWLLVLLALLASVSFCRARYVFQDTAKNSFAFVFAPEAAAAARDSNLVRPDRFLDIETIRRLGVTSTASNDYLPKTCTKVPDHLPDSAAEAGGDELTVLSSRWGYGQMIAEVQANVQQEVLFNHFYFPGWEAKVDGVATLVRPEPETGRMAVTVEPGRHFVELRFADTPVRLIGQLIAVATALTLLLWAVFVLRYEDET